MTKSNHATTATPAWDTHPGSFASNAIFREDGDISTGFMRGDASMALATLLAKTVGVNLYRAYSRTVLVDALSNATVKSALADAVASLGEELRAGEIVTDHIVHIKRDAARDAWTVEVFIQTVASEPIKH